MLKYTLSLAVPVLVLGLLLGSPGDAAIVLSALVVVSVVGYVLGSDTATALDELVEGTRQVASGEFEVEVSSDRVDEVGDLVERFERMATAVERRERSLAAERDRLAALFENSTDCIARVRVDDEVVVEDVNARFEERWGYDRTTIRGRSIGEFFRAADDAIDADELRARARRGEQVERELGVDTAEGPREFHFRFVPVERPGRDDHGTDGYVVCTDVTDRTRDREALESNNRALRALNQLVTERPGGFERTIRGLLELGREQVGLDAGVLSRVDGDRYEVVEALDRAGTVASDDEYELTQTLCAHTVSVDTDDVVTLADVENAQSGSPPARSESTPDAYIGTRIVVEDDVYGTVCFWGQSGAVDEFTENQREFVKLIARWIGAELERTQRREELERSQELLQRTQRLANVGGWKRDLTAGDAGTELYWTDEIYRIGGLPPEEPLDFDRALGMFHDEERVRSTIESAIESGEPYELEAQITTGSGVDRWVHVIGEPIQAEGETVAIYGVVQDVTDRRAREQELRDTTARLDAVVSNVPVILFSFDADGTVTLSEGKGLEKFGVGPGDLVGESVFDLYGDRRDVVEDVGRAIDGERVEMVNHVGGFVFETSLQPVYDDGEVTEVRGVAFDITEREQREQELRRTLRQLDALVENTSDAVYFKDADGVYQLMNEAAADLVGHDTESAIGKRDEELFDPQSAAEIRRVDRHIVETGEPVNNESEIFIDGERHFFLDNKFPYRSADGEIVGVMGLSRDITRRKQYEQALESLHEATRELLHTESESAVYEVVRDIAAEVIDVPSVGVYVLDSENSEFAPTAYTPAFVEHVPGPPSFPVGDENGPAWEAFVSGETVAVADVTDLTWTSPEAGRDESSAPMAEIVEPGVDSSIQSGLFVPVGDHAVVTILAESAIDDDTRQLVETLVATTEAALDRLESESSLRERDEQLVAQNSRLRRQIRLTDIIRTVDQSLIGPSSREEIESSVCRRLVESDVISFAWIGEYDAADDSVRPRSWAGDDHRYLDRIALAGDESEPSLETARSGAATVVGNVVDRLHSEGWRKVAIEYDFWSLLSVPIVHDDYTYGVVTAYAPEINYFGALERAVFVELGETIGNAINAAHTKQAMHADRATELELRFAETDSPLSTLAEDLACRVELNGFSTGPAGSTMQFLTVSSADVARIESVLDRLVTVTDFRVISESEAECHVEITVSEGLLVSTLLAHSSSVQSMVAEAGVLDVVVDLPPETSVREFVELLEDRHHAVELVARRDVERSIGTKAALVETLLESLTDRQRETLTTAYYSGYFNWPRDTSGSEVAAMLDVSQPTVSRHLRLAELAVFDQLFEAAPHSVATAV